MDEWIKLVYAFFGGLFLAAVGFYIWNARMAKKEAEKPVTKETNPLLLQAYERLALFTERIKLESLISRVYLNGMSAKDMQQALQRSIKEEFEHNITQQIYVNPEIWQAVNKMKDQNLYIINQLAAILPSNANAMDLNKRILDLVMNNPQSTMNNLVLEALQFEAKKLL
jgi:reverse gyrase